MSKTTVDVGGREVSLSNLEKVLYPATGFSKAQVLEYYGRVSRFMLPHLKDRALTLKRYPDGVEGEFFFEKRCPSHRPQWTPTASVPQRHGEELTACVVNDLATLIWVANLATLELHVPLARTTSPFTPDSVVFDLDPGEGASALECARVALILRDLFARLGLKSLVKTSGQKGLHVFVPLNNPKTTFEDTKKFSHAVALTLQKSHPDLVTSKMLKSERTGKVFINWEQNDHSKTMICVYSLRAKEKPFASCPLPWDMLEKSEQTGDPQRLRFTHDQVLAMAEQDGDAFALMLTLLQALPNL